MCLCIISLLHRTGSEKKKKKHLVVAPEAGQFVGVKTGVQLSVQQQLVLDSQRNSSSHSKHVLP